ncbi:MAG: hypothetical protein GY809_31340 [Planctomycetes bacterium]|nr:hypothetical protein [Planctomycetota bacterium]
MNKRTALVTCTAVIWTICACSTAWGIIDTRAIEAVREKSVLNNNDLQAIDIFVQDAVEEVLRAQEKDFATIAKTRSILLSRQQSSVPNQKQYTERFLESAQKRIPDALREAQSLPPARRAKVRVNLLIIAHALNHESLVPAALPYLSDASKPVSFWATQLVTSEASLALINGSSPQSGQIIAALNTIAPQASPETLSLILPLASQIKMAAGQGLILTIAEGRTKQYETNTVSHELADIKVLSGLCAQFNANGPNKTHCAQHFAQLLSYVIQRYAKNNAKLTAPQKQDLISIIAETEDKCISGLTKAPQSALRRAIERGDMTALMVEHDRLLGSATEKGVLPGLLHFSYKAGNQEQDTPLTLVVK